MDADWSVELGAEDAALEFPWSSPDGPQRYVALQRHPELLADIPEAVQYPALGDFLRALNVPSSLWLTAKCDVWTGKEEVEETSESVSKGHRSGLNPKNETLGKGTLRRGRNCKWQRNEWGGTQRNSAGWQWNG
jgi:hypothetical protein